jgi:hypothetical protein
MDTTCQLLISGSGVRNSDGALQNLFLGKQRLRRVVYCGVEQIGDLGVDFAARHVHVLRDADLRVPQVIGPNACGQATRVDKGCERLPEALGGLVRHTQILADGRHSLPKLFGPRHVAAVDGKIITGCWPR